MTYLLLTTFNTLAEVCTSNSKHINTSIWLTWIGKCERSSEEKMKIDEERNLVRRHKRVRNSATTSSRYSTWSQRKTRPLFYNSVLNNNIKTVQPNSPNFSNSIDSCQTCRRKLTTIQYNFFNDMLHDADSKLYACSISNKYQLSLMNLHKALHHGKHAANKGGCLV